MLNVILLTAAAILIGLIMSELLKPHGKSRRSRRL